MFCQNCGVQNSKDLNFCNRCGERLKVQSGEEKNRSHLINKFLSTIATVTLVGMGLPIMALLSLGKRGFSPKVLLAMAICSFAATVLIDGLLAWLMLQVLDRNRAGAAGSRSLSERITNNLEEPRMATPLPTFASVTEHTTRNIQKSGV